MNAQPSDPKLTGKPSWCNPGLPVIRFDDCMHMAATIMLSHGIPPVIVAGMLGHSISILLATYAYFIPTMQDEAARLMDEILMPIPIVKTLLVTHIRQQR